MATGTIQRLFQAFHIYSSPAEFGMSTSPTPTMLQVVKAMPANSILITQSGVDWSGLTNGGNVNAVMIFKIDNGRSWAFGMRCYGNVSLTQAKLYYAAYAATNGDTWYGWKEVSFL